MGKPVFTASKITKNTVVVFRFILFLTFLGHGLVSLGYSPSSAFHFKLVDSINFTGLTTDLILQLQGGFDIVLAILFLAGRWLRAVSVIAIFYLAVVGVVAGNFFRLQTGGMFGLAEILRRLPWILFALFIFVHSHTGRKIIFLPRVGISFAFLAHGIASLGFFGLNAGHIELATNIISEEQAGTFVYYSGISSFYFYSLSNHKNSINMKKLLYAIVILLLLIVVAFAGIGLFAPPFEQTISVGINAPLEKTWAIF